MHLIVDEWGTFIGKKENRFQILNGDKKEEYSADNVSQIVIAKASSISTGAIGLAMEKGIDIVCMTRRGEPVARIYPCRLGGTTLTRKRQLEAYFNGKGICLAKSFIGAKVKNQIAVLKALQKTRLDVGFEDTIKKIENFSARVQQVKGDRLDEIREEILGVEGYIASEYFGALSKILPFEKRERKAGDAFNTMLNYAYGILYSEVEKGCILAGLDPYFGFLHTDRYGKPSMVLDLIEEFRAPLGDKPVINLFVRKQVKDEDLERNGETVFLTQEGRQKVIEAVMRRLYGRVEREGAQRRFQNIIVEQARGIARFVLGESKAYNPYVVR